ncbi:MAG: potassium channel family protein [Candidatus Hydrothermarchaeales archaeon]
MEEIKRSFLALMTVILTGTLGFYYFERVPLIKSLYWTISTISTVGYGDITPKTPQGYLIFALTVFGGIGIALYFMQKVLVGPLIEGRIKEVFGMGRGIDKNLKNHVIVCGYGDVGENVIKELDAIGENIVVVEKDPDRIKHLEAKKIGNLKGVIQGDATEEETLLCAGIESAKILISALDDDAENVFITLTVKSLNKDVDVISRATEPTTVKKLYAAGASHVISLTQIAGTLLANAATKPYTFEFLQDAVTAIDVGGVEVVTVSIPARSQIIGKTLAEAEIKDKTGGLVVGIGRSGKMMPNPSTALKFKDEDVLIVLGRKNELDKVEEYVKSSR